MADIRNVGPIIVMACAFASSHIPSYEPIWIAITAFVCGMAMQKWWTDVVEANG